MKGQNNVDTTKTINLMEWCAGYCGIGLGLKSVLGERLRTIAYCELEGFAQANIISKMEKGLLDVAPLWSDLKTFPCQEFHGLVDILVAGYPCQPFSAAGKRQGENDPRHLWPYIRNAIGTMEPGMCFLENVEGHISLGLSTVISDLEELGYKVSWGIFSASEVGAPHQRKRVFILAKRIKQGLEGRTSEQDYSGWLQCEAGRSSNSVWSIKSRELGNSGHLFKGGWSEPNRSQHTNATNTGKDMGYSINAGVEGTHDNGTAPRRIQPYAIKSSHRTAWPSRPGEPQHAWEPPRTVGNSLLHGHTSSEITGGTCQSENQRRVQESAGGSASMADARNSRPSRAGRKPQSGGTVIVTGDHVAEAMGNADHGRLASGINAGSGAQADRGGESDIEQAESGQTEPALGGDADGPASGLDDAELQSSDSSMRGDDAAEVAGTVADSEHKREDGTTGKVGGEECENEGEESKSRTASQATRNESSGGEYAELCVTCDNRTDELRLLGNGVVPATAARAFVTLLQELTK